MATVQPALDPAELVARARAAYGPDGRPPLPETVTWDIFPFEGALQVKPLDDPVLPEPPRHGEDAAECSACRRTDDTYLWTDGRWRLYAPEPAGVPALLLEPREHLDLGDLDEAYAAELGVLVVRIERALQSVPGVARVHVNRWGDGGAHLHVWFLARPEGLVQLRGSCLPDWLDILPPLPELQLAAIGRQVADALTRTAAPRAAEPSGLEGRASALGPGPEAEVGPPT